MVIAYCLRTLHFLISTMGVQDHWELVRFGCSSTFNGRRAQEGVGDYYIFYCCSKSNPTRQPAIKSSDKPTAKIPAVSQICPYCLCQSFNLSIQAVQYDCTKRRRCIHPDYQQQITINSPQLYTVRATESSSPTNLKSITTYQSQCKGRGNVHHRN